MGSTVILASGRGSNFTAMTEALPPAGHRILSLITDRKNAGARQTARDRGIRDHHVSYYQRPREEAEQEILTILEQEEPDLVILAGFMRLLSPPLVRTWKKKIINIHPSLLPLYPGTDSIARSFRGPEKEMGITIHYVDEGMDTGPVIRQESFSKSEVTSLKAAEERIHQLEHRWYPQTVIELLGGIS